MSYSHIYKEKRKKEAKKEKRNYDNYSLFVSTNFRT